MSTSTSTSKSVSALPLELWDKVLENNNCIEDYKNELSQHKIELLKTMWAYTDPMKINYLKYDKEEISQKLLDNDDDIDSIKKEKWYSFGVNYNQSAHKRHRSGQKYTFIQPTITKTNDDSIFSVKCPMSGNQMYLRMVKDNDCKDDVYNQPDFLYVGFNNQGKTFAGFQIYETCI